MIFGKILASKRSSVEIRSKIFVAMVISPDTISVEIISLIRKIAEALGGLIPFLVWSRLDKFPAGDNKRRDHIRSTRSLGVEVNLIVIVAVRGKGGSRGRQAKFWMDRSQLYQRRFLRLKVHSQALSSHNCQSVAAEFSSFEIGNHHIVNLRKSWTTQLCHPGIEPHSSCNNSEA